MAAVKIGLDAGHGLKTSGKQTPDGIKEWTLNDKVRDKVVAILADYDCEIIHTDGNEGKTDETLASRLSAYMKKGCAVFVSIHHNANTGKWNNATGVEVFTDNNPTARDSKLAKCIYDRLVKYTGMKGRGVKKCDFYVINQDKIPAVLVEGGFMDGREDYKYITSDAGQTAYAKAVAEGLVDFLGLKKKKKATATKKPAAATTTKTKLYRVRKTWKDENGQIGAYKALANAKALADKNPGYKVFDDDGKIVYTPAKKSAEEIAKEVLEGKWGNGAERRKKLEAAGYNYAEVQKWVNLYLG